MLVGKLHKKVASTATHRRSHRHRRAHSGQLHADTSTICLLRLTFWKCGMFLIRTNRAKLSVHPEGIARGLPLLKGAHEERHGGSMEGDVEGVMCAMEGRLQLHSPAWKVCGAPCRHHGRLSHGASMSSSWTRHGPSMEAAVHGARPCRSMAPQ